MPLVPATRRQRWVDLCESEATFAYRSARATQRPYLKTCVWVSDEACACWAREIVSACRVSVKYPNLIPRTHGDKCI